MPEVKLSQELAFSLIEKTSQLEEAISDLKTQKTIALDVEGTSLDPYLCELLLLQLASPEKVYLFDARKLDLLPLKRILEDRKILKIAQNAGFDYRILKVKLGAEPGPFF